MELEVQTLGDISIGALLERQLDIQPHGLAAGLHGASVRRLHDPGAASGRHDEAMVR